MLYKEVLPFESQLWMTFQMQATDQYFPAVLFKACLRPFKPMGLAFQSGWC